MQDSVSYGIQESDLNLKFKFNVRDLTFDQLHVTVKKPVRSERSAC